MSNDISLKLAYLAKAVLKGNYRYTLHAAQQRIERRIERTEVEQVLINGEIIEDYPKHHYGPACLVYGKTKQGKVIHILCSLQETVDIVTLYEPSIDKWHDDLKTRRRKS